MNRRINPVALVALALVAGLVAGCSGVSIDTVSTDEVAEGEAPLTTATPSTSAPTTIATTTTAEATTTTLSPVDQRLAAMSVEDKVGQLLMPVLSGTSASAPTDAEAATNTARTGLASMAEIVADYRLGGVVYLGPNIADAGQTTTLSSDLQTAATGVGLPGLLIAVDQEGGRVARLRDGVTPLPAARTFTPDADAARAAMTVLADEAAAQGINVVFAPVADLVAADENRGVIGDRSFGADPEVVSSMVVAAIEGLEASGRVAATVKHWPGHGDTTVDSHNSLPVLEIDEATWRDRERIPFAAAVAAEVDLVMVGHLAMPLLDPSGAPATESTVLVAELLRDDLGYDGVVVSDALDMGAVSDQDPGEVAVATVVAGVDIVLASPDLAAARRALLAAVADGTISPTHLDDAVRRILSLKERLGVPLTP
ncbi:MAG: glycoside hydrolase family 3 protein [Acidimicrobiales bacterium]